MDQILPSLEITPDTYCLIVTRGHNHDEEALYHLVDRGARYVGMIGSRRKIRLIFDDLEAHVRRFVEHYNHRRYHESLNNLTPADVYFGRTQTILLQRERIKRETIRKRRLQHQLKAA